MTDKFDPARLLDELNHYGMATELRSGTVHYLGARELIPAQIRRELDDNHLALEQYIRELPIPIAPHPRQTHRPHNHQEAARTSRGRSVRPVSAIGGNDAHDTPAGAGEVSQAVSRPRSSIEDDKEATESLTSAVVVGGDEQSPLSGKGPARGYSWPPFEQGNEAALKHGVNSARRVEPIAREIVKELRAIPEFDWLRSARFEDLVWAYGREVARGRLLDAWLETLTPEQATDSEGGKTSPMELSRQIGVRESNIASRLGILPHVPDDVKAQIAAVRVTQARRADRQQLQVELRVSLREQLERGDGR